MKDIEKEYEKNGEIFKIYVNSLALDANTKKDLHFKID